MCDVIQYAESERQVAKQWRRRVGTISTLRERGKAQKAEARSLQGSAGVRLLGKELTRGGRRGGKLIPISQGVWEHCKRAITTKIKHAMKQSKSCKTCTAVAALISILF